MQQHITYRIITHPHLDAGAAARRRAWAALLARGGCRMNEERVAAMQAAAGMAAGSLEQQAGAACLAPAQPDGRVERPPLTAAPARPFSEHRLESLIVMIEGWIKPLLTLQRYVGDSYRLEIAATKIAERLRRDHGATVNLERCPAVMCIGGIPAVSTVGGIDLFRRWAANAAALLSNSKSKENSR